MFTSVTGESSGDGATEDGEAEASALAVPPEEMVTAALSSRSSRKEMKASVIKIMVMTIAIISALLSFKQSSPNSRFGRAQIF